MPAKSKAEKEILFKKAFPGDIFFSRNCGPVSWLIRKLTKFSYSHVFVKLNSCQVIEADTQGIKISNAEIYLYDAGTTICKVPLPDNIDAVNFISYLTSKIGNKYDYFLLLGHILAKIFKISRWRENVLNAANKYTCSEYVSSAIMHAGMQLSFDPSQITPKELYYALKGSDKNAGKLGNLKE